MDDELKNMLGDGQPIKGFKVDGITYRYDYANLDNNPIPSYISSDEGKALVVGSSDLEWDNILPEYSSSDAGKVLGVGGSDDAELEWITVDGLPQYNTYTDEGKALVVGSTGLEWDNILPAYSSAVGKVLGVGGSDYAELEWINLLPQYNSSDEGKALVVGSSDLEWDNILPEYSSSDAGKVLGVGGSDDAELEWINLLPQYDTSSDEGKALFVGNTGLEWDTVNGLPPYDISTDEGKVLAVSNSGLDWGNILPEYSSSDAGKVLSIDEYGDVDWNTVRELPYYDNYDNGKTLALVGGEPDWINLLPQYDYGDSGKVLMVNSHGMLEWSSIT